MAIYRNGVRVKRPSNPSSSSCDEEAEAKGEVSGRGKVLTEVKRKCRVLGSDEGTTGKQRRVDGGGGIRVGGIATGYDAKSEHCQVGNTLCHLPAELFELDDLSSVLSLDTWNFSLTEKERESLCYYLPEMDEASFKQTLTGLFEGQNFHFSSPLTDMLQQLKSGWCHPKIVQYEEALRLLQRKEHYHYLREYHNGMVNSCVQMRGLWLNHGDSDIEERLKLWHARRAQLDESKSKSMKSRASDMVTEICIDTTEGSQQQHSNEGSLECLNVLAGTKSKVCLGRQNESKVEREIKSLNDKQPPLRKPESVHCGADADDIADGLWSGSYKRGNGREEEREPSSSSIDNELFLEEMSNVCTPPDTPPSTLMFSFSVIHLLSAVRAALLAPAFDTKHSGIRRDEEIVTVQECMNQLPLLSFRELVRRVRARPVDRRILETQEPLESLVRGALRVLSNTLKTGVEDWKPLVAYDKTAKVWSWIGRASLLFDSEDVPTSAEAWCVSPRVFCKIQDAFANWLINAQEVLHELGRLARLPLPRLPTPMDEGERFRELRQQKGLVTISPTSNEMRALFHEEESIRYSYPDMVFYYTNAIGQKSAVAPLRRIGSKPNSKARDHPILKLDRPSHVTILCLVRDAAARLPHNTGTRADVCMLIRDSQFIVDDVADAQLSQVVSGALDRLHYERDPCVRFDGDKKLWVYLHADRDEDDFEDDGTTSTKGHRRPKKDGDESTEYLCRENQDTCDSEHDFSPPNGVNGSRGLPSKVYPAAGTPDLFYSNHCASLGGAPLFAHGQAGEDCVLPFIDLPSIQPTCANMRSHPMGWEVYSAMGSGNRF